jgi:hypothetical protein
MTEANVGILQLQMGAARCENIVQPANNNNSNHDYYLLGYGTMVHGCQRFGFNVLHLVSA